MTGVRVSNDSEGDNNQNVGVIYGNLIKSIVLNVQKEQPQALKNLPVAIGDFVGRSAMIDRIEGYLATQKQVAISAVVGMGGVGKSALAIQVADRLKVSYPDVQLYVNLQGTDPLLARQPADVIRDFLRKFGLEDIQLAAMSVEVQQDFYRSILAELKVLLVLDNAQSAAQVEYLLPGGEARVLMTSREQLGLAGVQSVGLEVLEPSEALELLKATSGRQALTPLDLEIATEIVQLCGQLPLALRIVGALLNKRNYYSWGELRDRLQAEQNRLAEFAKIHKIVNPGQDLDVRSCFAVSYSLLEETEQQVLAEVSAIPGQDFSLAVAEAITQNSEVADCLDRLCDLQLLVGKEDRRYQFHDLVRLFGREQLTMEKLQAFGLMALQWYIKAADYYNNCLREELGDERELYLQLLDETQRQTRQRLLRNALHWFKAEWKNLKDTLQWALSVQFRQEASQLPLLLQHFSALRGYQSEMLLLLEIGLKTSRQNNDRLGEANTLKALGDVQHFLKKSTEALENYAQAMVIYREVGARLGEANTLKAIGDVQQFLDQRTEALENYAKAMVIYREVGARLSEANTLQVIGILQGQQGNSHQAINLLDQSLAIYKDIGDRYSQAMTLQKLAFFYQQTGQIKQGFAYGQEASEILSDLGLLSQSMPKWLNSILEFAQQSKVKLVICAIIGLCAFPLMLTAFIALILWRIATGRFRK
jgi:tetratricopeptide (TPR) repeat protein